MNVLPLYISLAAASVRSELQYRANFMVRLLVSLLYQGSSFFFVWVVLNRFGTIGGWHLGDIAFLYGFRLLSGGLVGLVFSPMAGTDKLLREGEFDRYLVRPLSPIVQILGTRFQFFLVWDAMLGIALFLSANALVHVSWSLVSVIYLTLAIIGSFLVQAAIITLMGALAFRTLDISAALWMYETVFRTFANYPLSIFDSVTKALLTFLFPLAFVAYFPATVLLDRTGEISVPPIFAYMTPLVGIVLFPISYLIFIREINQYQSTGH